MNTTELIEIAKECCFSRQVVGDETALITFRSEQLQQLAQRIEQPHKQRIAELDKDCEILQTNLDAALRQVNQLREALQLIKIKDENKMYQSCPDCDYPGTCKSDMVCKSMPRSSIGNIAHKVLEETK